MIYYLKDLTTQREVKPGRWELARPVPGPLSIKARFREAWAVFRGRACAVWWF